MARPPSADSILKKAKKEQIQMKTPITGDTFLPNYSGVKGMDDKLIARGYTDNSVLFALGGKIVEDVNLTWNGSELNVGGDILLGSNDLIFTAMKIDFNEGISGSSYMQMTNTRSYEFVRDDIQQLHFNDDGNHASGNWDFAGDVFFVGDGSGLPYGHTYGNEIGWTQANAVQNTWYDISDANMVTGELNLVTSDGNGQLTFLKAGRYNIDWSGSFEADAANVHIQITVSINGTEDVSATNHFETVGVNRQDPCSGFTIVDVAANDTVNASIRTTDAGTPTLAIDHLMLRVTQVGGT